MHFTALSDITLFIYFSNAKILLESAPPPDQPVEDGLNWTRTQFEVQLSENSSKIAAVMGIDRAGDVQYLYMPIIIPKAFGTTNENASAAIIGNLSNAHSEPSFIYTDSSDLGSAFVIETLSSIPKEIRPEEALSDNFLKDASWAKATVPIGMATFPTTTPIFFGQKTFKGSIHDEDFEDNMEEISPIHLKWVKPVKEHVTQQANDMDNVNSIVKRLLKKLTNKKSVDNAAYVTAGTTEAFFPESVFFYVFSLSNQEKWKIHQDKLREFFIGNPSPVRNPQPPSLNPPSSPMRGVNFQPPIDSPPMVRLNPGANLAATATLPPFNPMVFLQQLSANMRNMGAPHQTQTIVVESRADKSRKSEAKFNNNMLQLLLIGGNTDITTPRWIIFLDSPFFRLATWLHVDNFSRSNLNPFRRLTVFSSPILGSG
jgi:hypothetical protein